MNLKEEISTDTFEVIHLWQKENTLFCSSLKYSTVY